MKKEMLQKDEKTGEKGEDEEEKKWW